MLRRALHDAREELLFLVALLLGAATVLWREDGARLGAPVVPDADGSDSALCRGRIIIGDQYHTQFTGTARLAGTELLDAPFGLNTGDNRNPIEAPPPVPKDTAIGLNRSTPCVDPTRCAASRNDLTRQPSPTPGISRPVLERP